MQSYSDAPPNRAPELRPYQHDLVERLREAYASGCRAPLLALPTGAGKTVIFTAAAAGAAAKCRAVLVVAHRKELIRQASAKLHLAGVEHGIIAPWAPRKDHPVQVGSVQTLARRLGGLPAYGLLVLDEAHHAVGKQSRALVAAQPTAKLLGVTATPARLDGKGLGIEAGGPFDVVVTGPTIPELVAGGYLAPCRCFTPERQLDVRAARVCAGDYVASDIEGIVGKAAITGDAVAQYRARADHLPAIAFCISVRHAEAVAAAFVAAGIRAASVHGGLPALEHDRQIAGLGDGGTEVLMSCDLISEGLDVPSVGAVILLRPTKSLGLYMQQVGRGMRPAPGKAALIVNDHVGNTLLHGLPSAVHRWSLAGVPKRQPAECASAAPPCWRCECGCLNPTDNLVCGNCREERPEQRAIQTVPGALVETTPATFARVRGMTYRQAMRSRLSLADLREFARVRGYKPGWAWHRWREQRAREDAA